MIKFIYDKNYKHQCMKIFHKVSLIESFSIVQFNNFHLFIFK
jgi:hypothetical protein